MPEIQPINDAYIDSIIKAADAYNPNLSKTQGIQLRELIKLMRDRFEQQLANVSGGSAAAEQVQTYAAMIAKGVPDSMKTYEVATDEKRSLTNSIYQWWPDGKVFFIDSLLDSDLAPEPNPVPSQQDVKINLIGSDHHSDLSDWNDYNYGTAPGFLNNPAGTPTGIKFIVDSGPIIPEYLGFDPPATTNFPGSVSSTLWYQEAGGLTTWHFTGLDNSKTYTIKTHSFDNSDNGETSITWGGITQNTLSFNNGTELTFSNIAPVAGEISGSFGGSGVYTAINGIILTENY